jgi:hypothetical protein
MKPLITKLVTLSYPWLDRAQPAKKPTDKSKFSGTFVFANEADIAELKAAAIEVAIDKWGPTKGPKLVTIGGKGSTFRNDIEDKYENAWGYISARADTQPGLVYRHVDPATITEACPKGKPAKVPQEKITEVFYPGAKVLALVVPFAYDHPENKGIGWALVGVQKMAEGERLDNRVKAEDTFSADLSEVPADLKALL